MAGAYNPRPEVPVARIATRRKTTKYSPHPGLAKEAQDRERLHAATGRTFEAWVELARRKGPKAHQECTRWLREEH